MPCPQRYVFSLVQSAGTVFFYVSCQVCLVQGDSFGAASLVADLEAVSEGPWEVP